LRGATRAAVVARVPHLTGRAPVTALYARSVLVIAQHHDRSGAFISAPGDDVLLAHALDACGERGASRAFFEWAVGAERNDPQLAWGLEQHLQRSESPGLRAKLADLLAKTGSEPPAPPAAGPTANLWGAWQDAVAGRRGSAVAALHSAVGKRSSLKLFLGAGGVDLRAHALLVLTVHALIPSIAGGEDAFFEHQAMAQITRRSRALYAGAFHAGMPESGDA